jgi:hypothetical protein
MTSRPGFYQKGRSDYRSTHARCPSFAPVLWALTCVKTNLDCSPNDRVVAERGQGLADSEDRKS